MQSVRHSSIQVTCTFLSKSWKRDIMLLEQGMLREKDNHIVSMALTNQKTLRIRTNNFKMSEIRDLT